jgi:iron complex outermembrane receptor protein
MNSVLRATLLGAILVVTLNTNTLAQAGSRQAAQPPSLIDLSLEALGELEVVTASKTPETIFHTSAAVWVLTQEDIRRSGATSIPELMRLVPGVQVSRIDSGHWAVGVRGFTDSFSKSLLVLIDGRSIYTPLFAGVYWGVHDVLLQDIDRIEVIRGPGGTIWGSNAVNGVINIITKPASDTHGMAASIGAGNVNSGVAEARYGAAANGFDYRLSAKAFRRAAQSHPDDTPWDEWWLGQVGFRSDWQGDNGSAFTLQGDVYRGSNGQRVSIGVFSPPSQQVLDDPLKVSGGHVNAGWRRATGPRGYLELHAYYDRTNFDGPHFAEARDTIDVDFLHNVALSGRHNLSWGAGARWSPGRFRQVIPTLDFTPRTQTATLLSAFVQDEIALVPNRVFATLGAKIERNHYTGAETQPTARLRWSPDPQQTLWGAVTRAVRTPSRIEADIRLTGFLLANPLAFSRVSGNPEIQAEGLVGYELGYRRLIASTFHVDIAAFHNDYDRLVSNSLTVVPPPPYILLDFPFANGIEGSADGGELALDWSAAPWWRLRGAYSRVSVNLRNKPGDIDVTAVDRYEGSAPANQVHLQSSLNLPHGVQLDQTYRYAGALRTRGVDAYHTGDIRLGWRASPEIELSIAGRDLFSPRHVEFPQSPGPNVGMRRSIFASVAWSAGSAAQP